MLSADLWGHTCKKWKTKEQSESSHPEHHWSSDWPWNTQMQEISGLKFTSHLLLTSPSDRYRTGRASTNCFTLLPLKRLWQWNQSFRGQNCFELICIFSGTMNRGTGSDSSLHHNAWSLELKTRDNSSLPRRSRLWDMDFNKVDFNLLVFNGHYLENWVRVVNSFMKLCETEQQGSVTWGHFLRAFRIYSEANAFFELLVHWIM